MGCVSPKLDQSVEALCRLNGGDNPVIEQLAVDILWHMYMLKARQVETKRLGKSVGPAKELRDLERAARRAIQGKLSKAGWAAAWARTHARIRNQIWRPKAPPIVSRKLNATGRLIEFERAPLRGGGGSVHVPGFDLLVPSPKDTLDAITTEQEQIKQTAGTERRTRKRDQAEHAAIQAIRSAYQKLTGKKGGRTTDANGRLTGRLVRLGREVDKIFSTNLFADIDSRRLR